MSGSAALGTLPRRIGLLLLLFILLSVLLAGCSGQKSSPPLGATASITKPAAQAVVTVSQPQTTRTAAQMATETRTAPALPAPTIEPPPSITPAPSSPPKPQPTSTPLAPQPVRLMRLAWSPDGKLLAVGSATGVYLYDTATWQEARFIPLNVSMPPFEQDGVSNIAFSFDSSLIGTEGNEMHARGRGIQVWRVVDGSFAYALDGWSALAASPTEGLWATSSGNLSGSRMLQLWRASDGQLERVIPEGRKYGVLQGVFFSSDGQLIATTAGDADGFVVSRVADGRVLSRAPQDSFWSEHGFDLAFRPGTSTMVVIGSDNLLGLWDARTGALIRQLSGPEDISRSPFVYRVNFAPDGASFATLHSTAVGTAGGTIQIWKADGTRGRSWPVAAKPADLAFSRDGRLLAVIVGQNIDLYNPSDGSVVRRLEPTWHPGIASADPQQPRTVPTMPKPTFIPPSNPGPTPTSVPRTIDKPTTAPSPIPLAKPTTRPCLTSVASELVDLYEETRLGCPTGKARIEWGAWEKFERGAMLWRSATNAVYAFGQQGERRWLEIPDRWSGQAIRDRGNPPPGLQAPVRGFGYVWGERDDLFGLLGWATDQERGFCFMLQPFERGFLLRSNAVQSCTPENLYNQATAPSWSPVSLAAYGGGWSDRRPTK